VSPLLLLDTGLALFYVTILRRQARPSMVEYWSEFFPASIAPADLLAFVTVRGVDFVTLALPTSLRWAALLCIPALIVLLARERSRLGGVFCVVFYLQMAVVGAVRLFPIGTGRAELFAHGLTLLLVAVGAHALVRSVGAGERVATAVLCALAMASVLAFGQRSAYRTSGDDAAVIRELERTLLPSDGLIVYPLSTFALGVYGRWPIHLEKWPAQGTGFEVVVDRPRTLSQHLYPEYTSEPWRMRDDLHEFLDRGYDNIVLFTATEAKRAVQVYMHEELLAAGYHLLPDSSVPPHVLRYQRPGRDEVPPKPGAPAA
jgi:hypothetical protein